MVHAQTVLEQFMLRRDHVIVVVLRKVRVQAVARLAGFSVADVVGKDDEVTRRVEELPGPEEDIGELWREELMTRAARAVKNQDGIGDFAGRVFLGPAEGCVVQAEFGERLARLEVEVVCSVVAFGGRGLRRLRVGRAQSGVDECDEEDELDKTVGSHNKEQSSSETGEGRSHTCWSA